MKTLARLCFEDEHRELQYFALEMVQKTLKKQPAEFIDFLEELIITKSWWDTVDWLAKLVGIHFKKHPQLIVPTTERWMASGNFWLQRVCLIFQLTYRDKTDFDLMKKYILHLASSKEFFLQKGAGWALRQHSRTDPQGITDFVQENPQLAPLTKREALRLIEN
ncbi:MAG: DNA alkylation repair protein [Saprospiraceae bacterium]|nr:DNA alkylation repair protein [Saprospiraceae bacterium]